MIVRNVHYGNWRDESIFFITCFSNVGTDDKGWLDKGASRTFGCFPTFQLADDSLKRNILNMHEYLYTYAVVEEIGYGVHPNVCKRWFYKYDREKDGFFPMEEPKEFAHYYNIALG
jgi:hypothetical protein